MRTIAAALLYAAFASAPLRAQTVAPATAAVPSAQSEQVFRDIEATLGVVPAFLRAYPEQSLPGAWSEMKGLLLGSTALEPRLKHLIALAVAAQIPSRPASYLHEAAAKSNGASDAQLREAIAMSALTRRWSTFIEGRLIDQAAFRRDVDRMVRFAERRTARATRVGPDGELPTPRSPETGSDFGARGALGQGVATGRKKDKEPGMREPLPGDVRDVPAGAPPADDTHRDIERQLGFVPGFLRAYPPSALAGAWSEIKALEINPNTALSGKEKELIGMAVAAHIPSEGAVYYHQRAAKAQGASDVEINEALALASAMGHVGTMLNGLRLDEPQFQRDVDQMVQKMGQQP